jgi:signal transduction histidine kinase/CheY-like chemotaxis protein
MSTFDSDAASSGLNAAASPTSTRRIHLKEDDPSIPVFDVDAVGSMPSMLVSLASASRLQTDSPPTAVKFQPRPLPKPGERTLLTRNSEMPGLGTAQSLTQLQKGHPKDMRSPPKLLASLNSGFAYQHSTLNDSPMTLGSKTPSPDMAKRGTGGAAGPSSRGRQHVRFGSEDGSMWQQQGPLIADPESNTSLTEGERAAAARTPKRLKARKARVGGEKGEVLSVAHVGGKTITTIAQRTVKPASGQPSEAAQAEPTITTVLGKKKFPRALPWQAQSGARPSSGAFKHASIPTTTPSGKSSPPKSSSPSPSDDPSRPVLTWMQLRYFFLLVTIVQVGVCCGIVWYLGYKNSVETSRNLANKTREAITLHVEDAIGNYVNSLLQAATGLATMTRTRFPEWTKIGGLNSTAAANYSLLSQPGALTDLSYQLSAYLEIPLLGISAVNHCHLSARRNDSVPGSHFYQLADPGISVITGDSTPLKLFDFRFSRSEWYDSHARTDASNNPRLKNRVAFFEPLSDFEPGQPHLNMLGEVHEEFEGYNNTDRPWFRKAKEQGDSGLLWSSPVRLIAFQEQHLAMFAMKPVYDNSGELSFPPTLSSGKLSYLTFAAFYFDFVRDSILLGLAKELGESGCVFLVEGNGLLVATNLPGYDDESSSRTQLLTSEDEFIWHMMDVLRESELWQFADSDPTSNSRTLAQEGWVASSQYRLLHPGGGERNTTQRAVFSSSELMSMKEYPGAIWVDNAHFVIGRTDWHVNARTLKLPGLDWIVIVVTKDNDFDGGLASTKVTTGWFTALVAVASALVSLALAHCISRPLMRLVGFMESVSVKLHRRKGGEQKTGAEHENATSEELSQMCHDWKSAMASIGGSSARPSQKSSPLSPSRSGSTSEEESSGESDSVFSDAEDEGGLITTGRGSISKTTGLLDATMKALTPPPADSAVEMQAVQKDALTGAGAARKSPLSTDQSPSGKLIPRSSSKSRWLDCLSSASRLPVCMSEFPMRETQLLQHTFGSMLESLRTNHQQLQTANESKRRFIRYIFHEVRVPFNAIVLGVEQLREDLYTEPLRPVEEMQDVVNILNEQSKVVARILNDVLSLQKIEDGALELECSPFNMLEMVCGTLRSFQPLFTEKKLTLLTELQSLEEAMTTHARKCWKRSQNNGGGKEENQALEGVQGGEKPFSTTPLDPSLPLLSSSLPPLGRKPSFSHSTSATESLQATAQTYAHDVLGDRYRLRQILANFLSNAVKFSPYAGQVTVSVTCEPMETEQEKAERKGREREKKQQRVKKQDADAGQHTIDVAQTADPSPPPIARAGPTEASHDTIFLPGGLAWTPPTHVLIRVAVTDSGRGLSLFEQQQLFQPYIQLSSGEQQQGKGTGLGLNISKSLIELSGGVIGVSSSCVTGQGCTFFFELPMEIVPSGHRSTSASPQVFHVADPKGPATMRAWLGANGSPPMMSPVSNAAGFETPPSSNSSAATGWKNSPSTFSLQGVAHTNAPLTMTVRQRMLERSHGSQSMSSLLDRRDLPTPYHLSEFSPLVGSSRRLAPSSRAQFQVTVPSSVAPIGEHSNPSPLAGQPLPVTPGTQQITMMSASASPSAHLSKLSLLQGLANETAGYGFGYSSRVPLGRAQMPNLASGAGVVPPRVGSPEQDDVMPVLTPVDDDDNGVVSPPFDRRPTDSSSSGDEVRLTAHSSNSQASPPGWNNLPSHIRTPSVLGLDSKAGAAIPPMGRGDVSNFRSRSHYLESEMKSDFTDVNDSLSQPSSQRSSGVQTPSYPLPYPSQSPATSARRTEQLAASLLDLFPKQPASSKDLAIARAPSIQAMQGVQREIYEHDVNRHSPPQQDKTFTAPPPVFVHLSTPTSASTTRPVVTPIPVANLLTVHPPPTPSLTSGASASASPSSPIEPPSGGRDLVPTGAGGSPPFRPRILVVEDSAPNRKLLVMLLRALKCDVVGVENGLLAVQEFAPWASASWVGENVAGRLDAITPGTDTHSPAWVDLGGLVSPSTAAASAELVRMGLSPSGASQPFEFPSDAAAGSGADRHVKCNYDLVLIDGNMRTYTMTSSCACMCGSAH